MITHDEYLKAIDIVIKYKNQINKECASLCDDPLIKDLDISVRLKNIIKSRDEIDFYTATLSELTKLSINDLSKARQFGVKARREFIEVITNAGLEPKY